MENYRLQLPSNKCDHLSQNEAFFYLNHPDGKKEKIPFHNYGRIYQIPGLYEQIFYQRLKCDSPNVISSILHKAVESYQQNFTELRVLDFGAGNGIMAQELWKYGVSRCVGVDIVEEAKEATLRDRPQVYDEYYIKNFTNLSPKDEEEMKSWDFNCLATVAALGFGDIPVKAFMKALNLISETGWVAFNIKETFFHPSDNSGFSKFIRNLITSDYLNVHFIERYRHRLSIEGVPLYYYAIVLKKNQNIPEEFLEKI